jgi:murein DD-endopeptidase MepM/ murein hydrolase activator NlpD
VKIPRWLKYVLAGSAAAAVGGYAWRRHKLQLPDSTTQSDPDEVAAAEQTSAPAADDSSSTLTYPVPGGTITSHFGQRTDPTTGKTVETHNGIDLRAAEGTPLTAPGDGTVSKIEMGTQLGGNEMWIKVGDYTLGFAHLQDIVAHEGDSFHAGDVLAHTGGGGPHEGKSTGPHLHMTVRDADNTLINPENLNWRVA